MHNLTNNQENKSKHLNTIFAKCSGFGKSGVAVFRISGPKSLEILQKLTVTHNNPKDVFAQRKIYLRKIYSPISGALIDEAMVVYFEEGKSFTGEDVVEIHTHGSVAVAKILTQALLDLKIARIAEPGEFARRAFFNGKFDLTSAEGLADLIDAETEMQHYQAIKQMNGELEKIYESWRILLLKTMSLLDASIDFPDEDIPDSVLLEVNNNVYELKTAMRDHLNDNRRGERLRNGIKLAIAGKPNAGKSSMLNFLMQREVAIVSDIAGTTRDIVEGHLDIGGYPVILQDTAGIREGVNDIVEQEGITRARNSFYNSDIRIIVIDSLDYTTNPNSVREFVTSLVQGTEDPVFLFFNKIDLIGDDLRNIPLQISNLDIITGSIKSSINLKALLTKIETIAKTVATPSDSPQITRERHRHSVSKALERLEDFSLDNEIALASEDIRLAARYLSGLTGKISVDEILGEIFSNFCIGK